MPSWGVAISTLNRTSGFNECYNAYKRLSPANTPIFIVDDGSDVPVPGAHHRNNVPRGIAQAKNAGLRLLMDAGVDHLFLSDDDAFPNATNWWIPYIGSGRPHLIHQPTAERHCQHCAKRTRWIYWTPAGRWECSVCCADVRPAWEDDRFFSVAWAAGVLVYVTRQTVELVGGLRPEFGIWGSQDWEYSHRIMNALGLDYPFISPKNSAIHSVDAYKFGSHGGQMSAIPRTVRDAHRHRNWALFNELKGSTDFVPY